MEESSNKSGLFKNALVAILVIAGLFVVSILDDGALITHSIFAWVYVFIAFVLIASLVKSNFKFTKGELIMSFFVLLELALVILRATYVLDEDDFLFKLIGFITWAGGTVIVLYMFSGDKEE